MTAITRRGLLATVATLPAACAAVSMSPISPDWAALVASVAPMHPNAPVAIRRARAAGMNPAEFSGVRIHGEGLDEAELPILVFGDWNPEYFTVSPTHVGRHSRVEVR